jgi:hypothetical protein
MSNLQAASGPSARGTWFGGPARTSEKMKETTPSVYQQERKDHWREYRGGGKNPKGRVACSQNKRNERASNEGRRCWFAVQVSATRTVKNSRVIRSRQMIECAAAWVRKEGNESLKTTHLMFCPGHTADCRQRRHRKDECQGISAGTTMGLCRSCTKMRAHQTKSGGYSRIRDNCLRNCERGVHAEGRWDRSRTGM